ncbi:MAG: glycerophosphodiester phosphodiesterase, partial [Chryseobacterium sp.]|nr:glycerophosphodiester phosphodiesterase [Candidatus Chryseobacterium enterohippi]
ETTLKELRSKKLSNGEELPTLENYLLQGSKDKKVKLIVEIKPAKNEALENEIVAKTLKIIQGLKLENQCEFISFSLNICKEIKKLQPQLMVQYLKGDLTPKQIKDLHIDGLDYHYTLFQKNATWIAEAKDLGLVTNSWTVNDEVVYQELKTMGINFITTNIPETLKNK